MADMKQQLTTALEKATTANDAVAMSVITDALAILEISTHGEYNEVDGAVQHVTAHLGRALTNITRNSIVRAYIPGTTSAVSGGMTPRGQIISRTVEAFKSQYEAQSGDARVAYDNDDLMLALVESTVAGLDTGVISYWTELKAGDQGEFRQKIVRTDIRKALADYVPEKAKAPRPEKKDKQPSPRAQTIALAVPYVVANYGKYPVDNGDLAAFIVESIEGNEALGTYWTELPDFNKLLIYADVRKGLGAHGILPPTKSVPKEAAEANGDEPAPKPKRAAAKKAKAEPAPIDPAAEDAAFEEAVATATELYGDGDEAEIRERLLRLSKDGNDALIHWVEGDRGQFGASEWKGTVIGQTAHTYFVLPDQE
jgi:hypothetical protein